MPANKCRRYALKLIMIYIKSICTNTHAYTHQNVELKFFTYRESLAKENSRSTVWQAVMDVRLVYSGTRLTSVHSKYILQRGLKMPTTQRFLRIQSHSDYHSNKAIDGNLCQATASNYTWFNCVKLSQICRQDFITSVQSVLRRRNTVIASTTMK